MKIIVSFYKMYDILYGKVQIQPLTRVQFNLISI